MHRGLLSTPGRVAAGRRRSGSRAGDGGIELLAAAPPYQHVRSIGEDVSAGEVLLPEGHRLRAVDVAAAAAAGVTELVVRRRPVAVLPTGDEIRQWASNRDGRDRRHELPDARRQAREHGCDVVCLPIEPDDPARITAAARTAAETADLVVLIAGSSAGRDDYTAAVVAAAGTSAVHGVAVRPGHPVVLGDHDVMVVRLVHRDQGLFVTPGNLLGVTALADLPRLRPAVEGFGGYSCAETGRRIR